MQNGKSSSWPEALRAEQVTANIGLCRTSVILEYYSVTKEDQAEAQRKIRLDDNIRIQTKMSCCNIRFTLNSLLPKRYAVFKRQR